MNEEEKERESHRLTEVFLITIEANCRTLSSRNHFWEFKISPRHWTCVPLQSPLDIHSRTREPTKVYPVLQEKMAVAPYTVSVPILLPFGGVPRSPQEMTEIGKQYHILQMTHMVEVQSTILICSVWKMVLFVFCLFCFGYNICAYIVTVYS